MTSAARPGLLLSSCVLAAVIGCERSAPRLSAEFFVMGGIPVHVTAWEVRRGEFEEAVEVFHRRVDAIEAVMSTYRARSLVSRANRGEAIVLDADTRAVLVRGLECARETGGAFDPTAGPLVQMWKGAAQRGAPPDAATIAGVVTRVGWQRLHLPPDPSHPFQLEPGQSLDLGGVAKGFVADVGVDVLASWGVRRGLVEIGGDLRAFDSRDRPSPFTVGVSQPLHRDRLLARLQVTSGAVVTSGAGDRDLEIGGHRFSHIVDPRTGIPARGLLAVTLLAPEGARADALATAVVVLGPEQGMAFVRRTEDVEALLVVEAPETQQGYRLETSPGLADCLRPVVEGAD